MISLIFHLQIFNGLTYHKHDLFDMKFDIDEQDTEICQQINDFSSTQSSTAFCYLVYTFICGRDDLEKTDDRLKYFDKFRFEFNHWHHDSWGLQFYGIRVLGLTINGKEWTEEDITMKSLLNYDWIGTRTDAYPGENGIEIMNGYCEYTYALKELANLPT